MNRKGRKLFITLLRLIVILGVPLCLFLIWRLEPLLVKNIVVTTDYDINANSGVVKILEGTRGKNLFNLKTDQLAADIKNQDIKIKEVTIEKKIPGKLLINIVRRKALAVVPQGSDFFLVDKDGLVIAQESGVNNLPIVNLNLGLQNLKVGSSIDSKDKTIFFILDWLSGKETILNVAQVNEDLELKLSQGITIILPFQEPIEEKLSSLQLLLTRFRIEGRQPAKIDLRFDKPVVTF